MNKKTLLLIGLGAAALFFITRGGSLTRNRRRGIVEVESPEILTEDEFNTPLPTDGGGVTVMDRIDQAESIADRIKNVFNRDPEAVKQRQQRKTERRTQRTARRTESAARRKQRADERRRKQQQRKAARQTRRADRRSRRRKVGDIPVFF